MLDLMLGSRLRKREEKEGEFCVEFYLMQTAASRLFIYYASVYSLGSILGLNVGR